MLKIGDPVVVRNDASDALRNRYNMMQHATAFSGSGS
jgi:hypothetical protein